MNAFEIAALVCAISGLCMVLGGIWLIAKGVITMAATPKADALNIEWKKQFRINTQIPGLGFFLVGLMFIATSLGFLKPQDVAPIEFEGQVQGVDEPISINVHSNWVLPGNTEGEIAGKIYPDFSLLVIVINAPGYEPLTKPIKVKEGQLIARLGTLQLRKEVTKNELKEEKQIESISFTPPAPSPTKTPGFGTPQ